MAIIHQGDFIVMDVTVDGDLKTANDVGYDGGGSSSSDPTKKPSFAEKLMGVKNTQCDHYLNRVQSALNNQENRSIVRIREDTNKVRYDFKQMEVQRKKRDLANKKKKGPFLDTEEDEFELARAQRYLFYNPNLCFYMDKKNMIPLRGTAKSDPYYVTPTVARARKMLQDLATDRSVDAMQEKRATMVSRKSTRSVRFRSQDDDEDILPSSAAHYNDKSKPRPQSMKHFKSTPSATTIYDDPQTVGLTKQEQLLAYLKRTKSQSNRFESLIDREQEVDVLDDFNQCQEHNSTTSQSKPSSGYSRRSQHEFSVVDGHFDHSTIKPGSGYSRRSHALSEDDSVFHFPSIGGEHTRPGEVPEAVQFGAIEDLPPHEVALLKQANNTYPPSGERPVKSAIVRRSNTQTSHVNRRHTSTSAHPVKRRQITHAMLRQEKAEVEIKLDHFLAKFEDSRPKHARLVHRKSQAAIKFKPNKETTHTADQSESVTKPTVQWQTPSKEEIPRIPSAPQTRGMPHHSQDRSKRHAPTFKLRRIVQQLMKNRTTSQKMEYEKMLAARAAGAKTPDPHAQYMH